jgi:hypothetical protein
MDTAKQWLILDLQIEKLQNEIEALKKRRDSIEPTIIQQMATSTQPSLTIDKYKLQLASENKYSHLSYTFLEKSLSHIIKDATKAKLLCEQIKTLRNKTSTKYIKRTLPTGQDR